MESTMDLWLYACLIITLLIITFTSVMHICVHLPVSLTTSTFPTSTHNQNSVVREAILTRGGGPEILLGDRMPHKRPQLKGYHFKFIIANAPDVVTEELIYMFNLSQRRVSSLFEREVFGAVGAYATITETNDEFPKFESRHYSKIGDRLSVDVMFSTSNEIDIPKLLSLFSDYLINQETTTVIAVWDECGEHPIIDYVMYRSKIIRKVS